MPQAASVAWGAKRFTISAQAYPTKAYHPKKWAAQADQEPAIELLQGVSDLSTDEPKCSRVAKQHSQDAAVPEVAQGSKAWVQELILSLIAKAR